MMLSHTPSQVQKTPMAWGWRCRVCVGAGLDRAGAIPMPLRPNLIRIVRVEESLNLPLLLGVLIGPDGHEEKPLVRMGTNGLLYRRQYALGIHLHVMTPIAGANQLHGRLDS